MGPGMMIKLAIVLFVVLTILFYTLFHIGRESAEDDPLLDPRFNPNIHNEEVDAFR
jgi:hypothetical protein